MLYNPRLTSTDRLTIYLTIALGIFFVVSAGVFPLLLEVLDKANIIEHSMSPTFLKMLPRTGSLWVILGIIICVGVAVKDRFISKKSVLRVNIMVIIVGILYIFMLALSFAFKSVNYV